jgi:hypothetical protein
MNTKHMTKHDNGAPIAVVNQYQSFLVVHPDHTGFIIGSGGVTVKKISRDTRCFIMVNDPNTFSNGMPWFMIKGNLETDVATAYHRLSTIANEAEKRHPRMNGGRGGSHVKKPRARVTVLETEPEPEPEKEVVCRSTADNDGKMWLVDPITNDVYQSDGLLVGKMVDGVVIVLDDEE